MCNLFRNIICFHAIHAIRALKNKNAELYAATHSSHAVFSITHTLGTLLSRKDDYATVIRITDGISHRLSLWSMTEKALLIGIFRICKSYIDCELEQLQRLCSSRNLMNSLTIDQSAGSLLKI